MTADDPAPTTPLVTELMARARSTPDAPALVEGEGTLTRGQVAARIARLAGRLVDAGVAPGDRVAIHGPNTASVAVAYFGAHAAGAIAIPLGPDTPWPTVTTVLEDASPKVLLAGEAMRGRVRETGASTLLWDLESAASEDVDPGSEIDLASLDASADLLFTTGTTGRPKGVLLSHRQVASAAWNINAFVGAREDDVEVVPIPLSHSFGLGRLRCWARVGHTLSLEPGLRNPARLLKRMVALEATGLALVPAGFAILRRMLRGRIADVADRLRYVEIGSAPLAPGERDWLLEHLPHTRLCHHYGLTEASRACFKELRASREAHPRFVGRATPHVEVTVRTPDGAPSREDHPGEIVVRGGMVMTGYWNQPELTAERRDDAGWLRTGDQGWADDDGGIHLLGRSSDIINVGGLKVAPDEVEAALVADDAILDAGVLGEPDPDGITGERVVAYVVPAGPDLDQVALGKRLRAALVEHQVPRRFVQVESIPRTGSGKIQRQRLGDDSSGSR